MDARRLGQFGWKPHTPATRAALKFARPASIRLKGARPKKFSLCHLCILLDQLSLGSCTAQAAAQAIRMACVASGAADPKIISRLWAYYLARYRTREQEIDAGSQVGTVFDVLADGGCPPEETWPYDVTKFATTPDTESFRTAHDSRGTMGLNYSEITGDGDELVDNVLNAVATLHGVAYGSAVTTDYAGGPAGIIHVNPRAAVVGNHAQVVVGYDENEEYVEVMGSWGDFGEPGQPPGISRFGFDYVRSEFSDLWIVNTPPSTLLVTP